MATSMLNVMLLSRSLGKSCVKKGQFRQMPGFSRFLHSGQFRKSLSYRQQQAFHKYEQKCMQILTARHASTKTTDLPFGYIPDVPTAPLEDVNILLPELNAIGEPTLESMGLGGYTPVGLIQQCIEMMHVTADVPWWGAIFLTAFTVRTLVFPMMAYSRKSGVHIRNHLPTFQRLNQKMNDAKQAGNMYEYQKRAREIQDYLKRNDVSFKRMFIMPVIQIPIMVTVYLAIRKMTLLPIESMKTGGTLWFTDLTVSDPFMILPAVTALSVLAMIELGAESQKAEDLNHAMKWAMRCMPIMVFAFTTKIASGITLYWTVNNAISLLSMMILMIPRVKKVFNIPDEVRQKKSVKEKKSFVGGFQEMWETSQLRAEAERRQKVDEMAFRKAGVGPVPKTYRENPANMNKKNKISASS